MNVEEMTVEGVWAYLNFLAGAMKEVETLDLEWLTAYSDEYSVFANAYKTLGGWTDIFIEFWVLFMSVALLQHNPYAMFKGKGSMLIAEFEGTRID